MDTNTIKKILGYIDEHICEKISLSELAKLAGYSPFYFSKLFSEQMGMPVTGYVRVRKLQYALGSLLEGRKVLEVSLMYAFDSHEGFTRSFTQLFGSTPSTVKKYLAAYRIPEYQVPEEIMTRRMNMKSENQTLRENLHQIAFEVLRTSLEEAKEGYCTEIDVSLFPDGKIRISDNGRGIPLSRDLHTDQKILDGILAGHPVSGLEYERMGDFTQCGMQTVNSLCESLQVVVYREGYRFLQDYVRGIAQHEVICEESEHACGMEMVLKPDTAIFGELVFSADRIREWVAENVFAEKAPDISITLRLTK